MAKRKVKSKEIPEAIPTSPSDWREGSVHSVTLPSGNNIKLRRVGLLDLVAQGAIPDNLVAITEMSINKSEIRNLDMQQLTQYVELLELVLCASAVEPKVMKRPKEAIGSNGAPDGYLYSDEVDYVDKVQIFQWTNGVMNLLENFRDQAQRRAPQAAQRR